jgi:magnesium-transporting ATPase (P-type)
VIREGCEQQVPAEELVVGDIVIIKNGARVAADARVLVRTNGPTKLQTKKYVCFSTVPV